MSTQFASIDLEALRAIAHLWLVRECEKQAHDLDDLDLDRGHSVPGDAAVALVRIREAIEEHRHDDVSDNANDAVRFASELLFREGVDFGLAVAAAVLQSPMTDPHELLADATTAARREVDSIAKGALEQLRTKAAV